MSISRYFIEKSSSFPAIPRPLDICHKNSNNEYVIYHCHSNDLLIEENHGTEAVSCNSIHPIITNRTNKMEQNGLIAEESFNCIGEDNYFIHYTFSQKQSCLAYLMSDMIQTDNISISYIATNVCFYYKLTTQTVGAMYYCNGFYGTYRFFQEGTNCLNELFNGSHDIYNIEYTISTSVCNIKEQLSASGINYPADIMHQCIINGVEMTPYSYNYDETDRYQISIEERIGLIDLYIATGRNRWAEYDCYVKGLGAWDLVKISEYGNIFTDEDNTVPICGVVIQPSSPMPEGYNIFTFYYNLTQLVYGRRSANLPPNYHDPFVREVNMNKTIVWGLHLTYWWGLLPTIDSPSILIDGSLPYTICKLHNLQRLFISGQFQLVGTLPNCLGDLDLSDFALISLPELSGTIPNSLCNVKYFQNFWLYGVEKVEGTIPECLEQSNFKQLWIRQNPKLNGTIPEGIFCNQYLIQFRIANNTGLAAQTVPECFSDYHPFLQGIEIGYSKLYGTLPTLPAPTYFAEARPIYLQGNNLEGTITDIFEQISNEHNYNYTYLAHILLHDNQFTDNDITNWLRMVFENSEYLLSLTLANNKYISGSIPDVEKSINPWSTDGMWAGFLFHNCDFYGTIPERLDLSVLSMLTLHHNRLSGYIPNDMRMDKDDEKIESIVLPGNLLWANIDGLPEWLDSPFVTASNIYYSWFQRFTSILLIICGFIAFVFVTLYGCFERKINEKLYYFESEQYEQNLSITFFFDTLRDIQQIFGSENFLLLMVILILIIFYSVTCDYYYVVPYETMFALSWYWIDYQHDANKIYLVYIYNATLLILALSFHGLIIKTVYSLCMIHQHVTSKLESKPQEIELAASTKPHKMDDQDKTHSLLELQPIESPPDDTHAFKGKTWKLYLQFVMYLILWMIGMIVILIHLLSTTLPQDNTLNLGTMTALTLSKFISLILVLNNKYVIPPLASCISKIFTDGIKYKYEIILILRLNNAVILPIMASLFLLDDCGKYWINLWNHCNDQNLRQQFDIAVSMGSFVEKTTVLRSEEICEEASISGINYNKCLRSFLYFWTAIMMTKLVINIIIELMNFLYDLCKNKQLSKDISKHIDGEYISISIDLLISLTFSFCVPLIIPINISQILIQSYLYKRMRYKYKWKFDIKYANKDQTFPAHLLWIGVALNQFFTVLFFGFCVENIAFCVVILIALLIMDSVLILKRLYKHGKKDDTETKAVDDQEWIVMFAADGRKYYKNAKTKEIRYNEVEIEQIEEKQQDILYSMESDIREEKVSLIETKNAMLYEWFDKNFNFPETDIRKYTDIFILNGFDNLSLIKQITSDDLNNIGITKLVHRKLILKAIANQREIDNTYTIQ